MLSGDIAGVSERPRGQVVARDVLRSGEGLSRVPRFGATLVFLRGSHASVLNRIQCRMTEALPRPGLFKSSGRECLWPEADITAELTEVCFGGKAAVDQGKSGLSVLTQSEHLAFCSGECASVAIGFANFTTGACQAPSIP